MELAAAVARADGEITIVGLHGGSIPVAFGSVPFECPVAIPYWGSAVELMEVLELARQGKIAPHVERFPLDRAGEAYERMRAGTLDGRAVIVP